MKQTKLILVGGFLGAGKTSMLQKAAEYLKKQGKQVGLITNDQATNLVDTSILKEDNDVVYEVSGSCFCCNFPGFADAVAHVAGDLDGGITLAEPVGSCTDLSATIMQPLKEQYRELADTAPLTVMADPERLRGILDEEYSTASYIVTKQFDESDIILINKIDLLTPDQIRDLTERTAARWPHAKVMCVSVLEGTGMEEWINTVLDTAPAGTALADVDYDLYADGEAAYGWLNATYQFAGSAGEAEGAAELFLRELEKAFQKEQTPIGHVKFLLQTPGRRWIGNLTGGAAPAGLRAEPSDGEEIALTVNARAELDPKTLQDMVLGVIDWVFGRWACTGTDIRCLIPGRPNPTYRYSEIVR